MADEPAFSLPPEHTEARPPAEAGRLLMGGPVVLVTTTWRGKPNVIPVSWFTPLSADPPLIGIAIDQARYSADLISHAQEFALNFPKRPYLHHVQYLGTLRGEEIDKFEATQWETFHPARIASPLLQDCAGWVECEVVEVQPFGDHILFVGEVVAVRVDPQSYDPDRREWRLSTGSADDPDHRVLHFLGGADYSTLNRRIEARVPRDYEAPEAALRERIAEELELSREARERREERVEALHDQVRRGNVVDVDELELELDIEVEDHDLLDLTKGIVLGGPQTGSEDDDRED